MLASTNPSLPLKHTGIVVTRPAQQADTLCRLIEAQGGTAIRFPTLEIGPPQHLQPVFALIEQLDSYDWAIFVSANAVHWGLRWIQEQRTLPPQLQRIAIGRATARALDEHGVPAHVVPTCFTSESLLALPALQAVTGLRIIIFRGEGGRDLLGTTLRQRGACIDYAEVYRRNLPVVAPDDLLQSWQHGEIQAVIITSNESLQNLFALVGTVGQQWLLDTPLIVISKRAQRLAQELGFRRPPRLAEEASDKAIVQALLQMVSDPNQ
ncbi:MAG: uroporphyrinogen-III synthase [Candidatus Competibacteraceae bacterium]|jgi:uroporphyrinogen-III synthase|nr:uroporphyrinogen-III synthase [Candidatus Competibacteraceae bacterium]